MNGLILFIGESFRIGGQGTRNRGHTVSHDAQILACNSHISFIDHIIQKFNLNSVSVFISSYTTQYDNELLKIYNKYLIGQNYYSDVIGLNNLFHNSINKVINPDKYDFILYIRIDLYLKTEFLNVFNPTINTILFPTICWFKDCKTYGNDPRVNDMLIFIPNKYYKYINHIIIGHNTWHDLIKTERLTYNDMDTIINTYHDSDSAKDYNPLYYIVNRAESTIWHSAGEIFNKKSAIFNSNI